MLFLAIFLFFPFDTRSNHSSSITEPSDIPQKVNESIKCEGISLVNNASEKFKTYKNVQINLTGIELPERFDAREKWPNCVSLKEIKKQHICSGSWGYAVAAVIEARYCITHGARTNRLVSPEELIKCCKICLDGARVGAKENNTTTCVGGSVETAFHYWASAGVSLRKIGSRALLNNTKNKTCSYFSKGKLGKFKNAHKSYALMWYKFNLKSSDPNKTNSIQEVQSDILFNGPVVGFFEFYRYIEKLRGPSIVKFNASAVEPGEKPRLHAIVIIGWGEKDNVPVWIFANTWGTDWCDKGFCTIPRGVNELKIEQYGMVTGLPGFSSSNIDITVGSSKQKLYFNMYFILVLACIHVSIKH